MFTVLALVACIPQYVVTYCPGGETAEQARKRVGGVEVIGGGYYAKAKGVRHSIDLVILEGETVIKYRHDLARPVLTIDTDGNVRIDPTYKPQASDWYALAGAKVPTDPGEPRARQIIGIVEGKLKFYRLSGTYRQCEKKIKVPHLYMDGGTSANPGVRMPSHVVRLK